MNLRYVLLIVVSCLVEILYAQTGYRSGYVIKSEGDTLFGLIDFRSEIKMCEGCEFKLNDSTATITFTPDKIMGYRFTDGKYFVRKKVNNKVVFLEFLIKGRVNIYYSTDIYSDHYYVEKDSFGLMELPYKEEYKIKGDRELFVQSKAHIGLLSYYMQDAPGIESQILSIKKPETTNLITLAKNYHNAVCDGEKCIIYEQKPPAFKMNLEVCGGLINIANELVQKKSTYFNGGVLAHFWMPNLSENVYLRTGFLNGLPLQIEYFYPLKGVIQPKAAVGVLLFPVDYALIPFPSGMLGVNFKIDKRFYMSLNYDLCFFSKYIVVPESIIFHSLMLGINVVI